MFYRVYLDDDVHSGHLRRGRDLLHYDDYLMTRRKISVVFSSM